MAHKAFTEASPPSLEVDGMHLDPATVKKFPYAMRPTLLEVDGMLLAAAIVERFSYALHTTLRPPDVRAIALAHEGQSFTVRNPAKPTDEAKPIPDPLNPKKCGLQIMPCGETPQGQMANVAELDALYHFTRDGITPALVTALGDRSLEGLVAEAYGPAFPHGGDPKGRPGQIAQMQEAFAYTNGAGEEVDLSAVKGERGAYGVRPSQEVLLVRVNLGPEEHKEGQVVNLKSPTATEALEGGSIYMEIALKDGRVVGAKPIRPSSAAKIFSKDALAHVPTFTICEGGLYLNVGVNHGEAYAKCDHPFLKPAWG